MVRTFLIALLMAFSDLEKRKHKNFLGKRYTPAHQYWTKTLGSLLKQVTKTIKQITDMMHGWVWPKTVSGYHDCNSLNLEGNGVNYVTL